MLRDPDNVADPVDLRVERPEPFQAEDHIEVHIQYMGFYLANVSTDFVRQIDYSPRLDRASVRHQDVADLVLLLALSGDLSYFPRIDIDFVCSAVYQCLHFDRLVGPQEFDLECEHLSSESG